MPGAPRVIVVGAGVVGLATAYALRREGAQVVVVADGPPPTPTSQASLGILTHPNGDDGPYSRLYRDGHAAYGPLADELLRETGIDIGWRKPGGIDLAFDEADEAHLEDLRQRNSARDCPSEFLSQAEIHRRVPSAAARIRSGLFFPDDHRVAPAALSCALVAALEKEGAALHWNASVLACRRDGEGIAIDTGGPALRADAAILAAGAWTAGIAANLEAHVPVRPVRGQHCRFAGGGELPHILRHDGKYLVADGGDIIAGATVEDIGFAPQTSDEGRREMTDFFSRLLDLPALVLDQRAGLRPKPKGGRPLIGPLQSHPNVFVATGHYKNGVLLAAITGQLLARWIVAGDPGRDMSHFRPER